jgi:hypothetical protein
MKVIPKPIGKSSLRAFRKASTFAVPERTGMPSSWQYRGGDEVVSAASKLAQVVAMEQIKQLSMSKQMLAACADQANVLTKQDVLSDKAADVLRLTEFIQTQLQSIFDGAKSAKGRASNPKVSVLAHEVCSESRRLFDLIEGVRWKALEAQADDDIDHGRTTVYDSVEDLFKALHAASV